MANRKIVESTLRPVSLSTPTIQAPNVSEGFKRPDESNAALEIANAFAAFNPALAQITAINTQEAKEKDFLEAKKEAASQTLDQNRADLAELSRKGAIEEGANPWTNIYRSQLLARSLVVNELSQKAGEILPSVSQSSSSPDDAKNAMAELHNKYADKLGDNQYAQESFESAFSSLSNEFLQQSEAIRRRNIVQDTSSAFQDSIASAIDVARHANLADQSEREPVAKSVKLSLDNARLHGVNNANKLFLEQFKASVSEVAMTDPVQATAMLSMLDDIKPNGVSPIANTADGKEAIFQLRKFSEAQQKRLAQESAQMFKARKDKTLDDIQDFAVMFREQNPQASSEDLNRAISDNFGRTDAAIIKFSNKIVDADRSRNRTLNKEVEEENWNTFVQAIATGQLQLANTMAHNGTFYGEKFVAAKELVTKNVFLDKKLGSNPTVTNSFGIVQGIDPTVEQSNAIIGVNKAIILRANELRVSPLEVYNNQAEMRQIIENEKLNYQSILEANKPKKAEEKKVLDSIGEVFDSVLAFPRKAIVSTYETATDSGTYKAIGDVSLQAARGVASAPFQVAKNVWSTLNWGTDAAFGRRFDLVKSWEESADYLANAVSGEGAVADVSKKISANIVEIIASGGGSAVKLAGKAAMAGFLDNESFTKQYATNETAQRLASAGETVIGLVTFGIAQKVGSAALKGSMNKIFNATVGKSIDGLSPFQASAKIANDLGHADVSRALLSADAQNIAIMKNELTTTVKSLNKTDLNSITSSLSKEAQDELRNSLGSVPKEILNSGETLADKARNIVDYAGSEVKIGFTSDLQALAHYSTAVSKNDIDAIAKLKPVAEQAIDNLNRVATAELKVSKADVEIINSLKQNTLDKLTSFPNITTKAQVLEHAELLKQYSKVSILENRAGTSSAQSLQVRKDLK